MSGASPRVSVALATFDGAAYLEPQLRSILAQTRPVDELVISDDGSRDDTLAVAESVLAGAPFPVQVLRNPAPLGASRNFERAVHATTGDVLVLCDQDDVWHPDRVARALPALDGRLLVHGDARRIDGAGRVLPGGLLGALRVTSGEYREIARGEALRTFLRRNLVTGATTAFRRELLELAGPFPDAWVHDEWLGIVAAATGGVRLLREPLVDYRQHERNEIGAGDLTLGVRVGRLRADRAARNTRMLRRAEQLRDRMRDLPADVLVAGARDAAEAKVAHERARSAYPAARAARLLPVLRELATGRYSRYGRARFDVARDLLQPAGDPPGGLG